VIIESRRRRRRRRRRRKRKRKRRYKVGSKGKAVHHFGSISFHTL